MSVVPLLSAKDLSKSFGIKTLFEEISISINPGEKVALIGPNGSGKSTLLRMIGGLEHADSGAVYPRRDLRCSYVPQEDQFNLEISIAETLRLACANSGLEEYEIEERVRATLRRAGFSNSEELVSTLSGGWKKRLAIVRGLITEPELLLVDEPTNHLDIDGVLWLEELLGNSSSAIVFVSHDRYFIERLAERVVEINRRYPSGYFSADGDYADFLEARSLFLTSLKQERASLANRVRREIEWLRQGAKARTTKSKHRTAEAHKMVADLKSYQLDEKRSKLEFAASNRKTKELIKLEEISKSIGGRSLFQNISFTLSPGVRLGVVGPNGSGKTTFMKTLLGELKPDSGRIVKASNLRMTFFDQARAKLDRSVTLKRALAPNGGDSVIFNDRSLHVVSWAKRFLFSNEQLSVPVEKLSGGEQARVLLAQIMLEQSDILFFDEPTNDLDIDTLEVLEESFEEFPGAIVLITHDRYLLDQSATTVLGLATGGGALYANYLQWEEAYQNELAKPSKEKSNKSVSVPQAQSVTKPKGVALTQEESRELRSLESKIEKAEKQLAKLNQEMMSDAVSKNPQKLSECVEAITAQHKIVEELSARWEELEEKKGS